jgi:ketosteroid isomerase-like protein
MISAASHHVGMTSSPTASITIRRATQADLRILDRLARLDSQRLTAGPHLVAEGDDGIVAAIDLHDGRLIADPFQLTAGAVELLRERAGHITASPRREGVPALALMRGLFPASMRRA